MGNIIIASLLVKKGNWVAADGTELCEVKRFNCDTVTEPRAVWVYYNPADDTRVYQVSKDSKQVGQVSINTVTLTGTNGTCNIAIDGTDYLVTWNVGGLPDTADDFVTSHAADILADEGVTVTADAGVLTFTSLVDHTAVTAVATGDLDGTDAVVQAAIENIGWYPGIEVYSSEFEDYMILNASDIALFATTCNGCCDELITIPPLTLAFPDILETESDFCIVRTKSALARNADLSNVLIDYGIDFDNVSTFENTNGYISINLKSTKTLAEMSLYASERYGDAAGAGVCACELITPITIEEVYESDGVTRVYPNAGRYDISISGTYYIKLTDIETTATNAPVINSSTPDVALDNFELTVYTVVDAKENMLKLVAELLGTPVTDGDYDYVLNLSWDNEVITKTNDVNLNVRVS